MSNSSSHWYIAKGVQYLWKVIKLCCFALVSCHHGHGSNSADKKTINGRGGSIGGRECKKNVLIIIIISYH